jgi:hypothetical protein
LNTARITAKNRRALLKSKGLCINGERHGAATHGPRCGWCDDVHKRGIEDVLDAPKFERPPGHVVKNYSGWRLR